MNHAMIDEQEHRALVALVNTSTALHIEFARWWVKNKKFETRRNPGVPEHKAELSCWKRFKEGLPLA